MDDERIVRMAEIEIDPDQLDTYLLLLSEEIEASVRLEDGVLALGAVALKDQPHRLRILEVYRNVAAYHAHLKTPHFRKYKTGTAGMVTSLTLLDVDPIMMCSK